MNPILIIVSFSLVVFSPIIASKQDEAISPLEIKWIEPHNHSETWVCPDPHSSKCIKIANDGIVTQYGERILNEYRGAYTI